MTRKPGFVVLMACLATLASSRASADLYTADAAYRAKDFPRAFELYRELAELGRAEAQESLAVMYVGGEGVKRDNKLGFAWASLVLEQQPNEAAQEIIAQLTPHMTDAGRKIADELRAKYGKDALRKSILALDQTPAPPRDLMCRMVRPANPDDFYPRELAAKGIEGFAIIEARIFSDGRDHDPHAERQIPAQPFNGPAMLVSMNSAYGWQHEKSANGEACKMRFKVRFDAKSGSRAKAVEQDMNAVRQKAVDGDPDSQLLYGLLLQNSETPNAAEVPRDWFVRAAQAGHSFAQYLVGRDFMASNRFVANEEQGIFWLDKAAHAGNSDAQLELADYYLRNASNPANARRAVELLGAAVATNRPEARFYLSALLASHPDSEVRNPKRALEIFGEEKSIYELSPIAWEIRAAAHANLGEFTQARDLQERAIRLAKNLGWDTTPLKARLAGYVENKQWTGDLLAFY